MLMPDSQPSSRKSARHHSFLHSWFAVLSAAASSLAVTVLQPFRRMSWLLQGVRSKQPEPDPASKNLAKLKDYHQLAKVTQWGSGQHLPYLFGSVCEGGTLLRHHQALDVTQCSVSIADRKPYSRRATQRHTVEPNNNTNLNPSRLQVTCLTPIKPRI